MSSAHKDFSSVSPSARSLLMMKGYTDIPYARQTAALMKGSEVFDLSFDDNDFWFWIRVMHFEKRYKSIDELLQGTTGHNIMELSSGFSMRCIDACARDTSIHYIDTDLPDVMATKQAMIDTLGLQTEGKGHLELLPLNVLDEQAFLSAVARFDAGPVSFVNEGLLMYLNMEEKEQLCRTIRKVLKQRDGCWITADIYVKRSETMRANLPQSKSESAFLEQHRVEENKFDSYPAAEAFFRAQGFEIMKEASSATQGLSVLPQLLRVLPEAMRASKEPPPKDSGYLDAESGVTLLNRHHRYAMPEGTPYIHRNSRT